MVGNLKTDICSTIGGVMSEDVSRMLDTFAANSESIENNFGALRQRIDDLERNVIVAIKQEK